MWKFSSVYQIFLGFWDFLASGEWQPLWRVRIGWQWYKGVARLHMVWRTSDRYRKWSCPRQRKLNGQKLAKRSGIFRVHFNPQLLGFVISGDRELDCWLWTVIWQVDLHVVACVGSQIRTAFQNLSFLTTIEGVTFLLSLRVCFFLKLITSCTISMEW
jgi:hypothetical protein